VSGEHTKSRSSISIVPEIEKARDDWNYLCNLSDIGLHEPFAAPIKY
jgi:hypothetical protein